MLKNVWYTLLLLHPFNGLFSRTTWVSRHQKGKPNNHASSSPLGFYRLDALPAAQPTASKHWRQLMCDIHYSNENVKIAYRILSYKFITRYLPLPVVIRMIYILKLTQQICDCELFVHVCLQIIEECNNVSWLHTNTILTSLHDGLVSWV